MNENSAASKTSFSAVLVVVSLIGIAALTWAMTRPDTTMTLNPDELASVSAVGILKGSADAPVQVIEFADFECPGCAYFATVVGPEVIEQLVESGEISFRFFDLPLDRHPHAVSAHNAAHCANEQGKFWEMHDLIFRGQYEWHATATKNPKKILEGFAKEAGLNFEQWNDCYLSKRMLPQIAANRNEARRLGIRATPTFLIGDRVVKGSISFEDFRTYVQEAKAAAKSGPGGARAPVP